MKIEVCFYKHDAMIGTTLRISGNAEFVYDTKLKAKALTDRPSDCLITKMKSLKIEYLMNCLDRYLRIRSVQFSC
jgi:hypothetical protein